MIPYTYRSCISFGSYSCVSPFYDDLAPFKRLRHALGRQSTTREVTLAVDNPNTFLLCHVPVHASQRECCNLHSPLQHRPGYALVTQATLPRLSLRFTLDMQALSISAAATRLNQFQELGFVTQLE